MVAEILNNIGIVLLLIVIGAIPITIFIVSIQKTLNEVAVHNRKISTGITWLIFIPLLNTVLFFYIVPKVAKSIEMEYKSRGISKGYSPTLFVGMLMAITGCLSLLTANMYIAGVSLITFLAYWTQIVACRRKLQDTPIIEDQAEQTS